MAKHRRSFPLEEKLRIIQEAAEKGIAVTRQKYGIAHSVLLRWRNTYKNGLPQWQENFSQMESELNTVREENRRLKKIVADQVLELQIKSELLQKVDPPITRRGYS